jgi:hypothetical protein
MFCNDSGHKICGRIGCAGKVGAGLTGIHQFDSARVSNDDNLLGLR